MPIIIVRVLLRSKTVFEWEGLPVDEDMNIEDFFNDVVVNELKTELDEVYYYYCDECYTTVSNKKRGKVVKFQVTKRSRK